MAVQVTVVAPTGNAKPEAGRQATVTPGQLSCAAGNRKVTTAVLVPGSVFLTRSAGWASVGLSSSTTVTWKLQVALLPEVSVAVQLTVVVPIGKIEPDGGTQLVMTPGVLSVAVTMKVTTAEQSPVSLVLRMSGGQIILGVSASLMVTLKVTLVLLLEVSVAVQVTVVTPIGKVEPDPGEQATVTPGQLSCATGNEKVTTAVSFPASGPRTISEG